MAYDGTPREIRYVSPGKLQALIHQLDRQHVVLVRSHPGSGKTTLAGALKDSLEPKGVDVCYVKLNTTKGTYDDVLKSQTGRSLGELAAAERDTVLIVDEAQLWYGWHDDFWVAVSWLVGNNNKDVRLYVLILATYRSDVILAASPKLGIVEVNNFYDKLRMERDDVKQLMIKHATAMGTRDGNTIVPAPHLSDDIIDGIYGLTGGHPALSAIMITTLLKAPAAQNKSDLLTSETTLAHLKSHRSFDWLVALTQPTYSQEAIRLISRATSANNHGDLQFNVANFYQGASVAFGSDQGIQQSPEPARTAMLMVKSLEKSGLWMCPSPRLSGTEFTFTSRLAYDLFYQLGYSGDQVLTDNSDTTF